MTSVAATTPVDDYVFLLGRPPIGELLGFIRNLAMDGQAADQAALTQEWRVANDHLSTIEKAEAGRAVGPPQVPLPTAMQPFAERMRAEPMFRQAYRLVPTRVVLVELDRLVVSQKFINLGFIAALKASLPAPPSEEAVARLAFGLDRTSPQVQFMQNAPNIYSALTIGFGSNYLNALEIEGRLILHNGSHRAYALRDIGLTHAPCLVRTVTRREELDLVASGDIQQNPDRYLKDPRPPLLKDYFDPQLRKVVPVPRKNRLVRMQFGVEQSEVPAA